MVRARLRTAGAACVQLRLSLSERRILQGARYLLEDLMGYQGLLMLKLLVKAVTLKNCYLVMVSWLCFARRCLKILVCAVT